MKYINQLEYAHLPYPTKIKMENIPEEKKKTTVRSSGCGLCCACMTVDLLTDKSLEIEECVRIAEECGANHSVGTNMTVLAPVIAEKFGLEATAEPANEDYVARFPYESTEALIEKGLIIDTVAEAARKAEEARLAAEEASKAAEKAIEDAIKAQNDAKQAADKAAEKAQNPTEEVELQVSDVK